MAFKTAALLVLLAVLGIFKTQAASVVSEKDMWNYRDSDSDEDKRTEEEDIVESEYFPDERDAITEDEYAPDVAEDTDYYNNAVDTRAAPCRDRFPKMCIRFSKTRCRYGMSRKMISVGRKFCHRTCPRFCKK